MDEKEYNRISKILKEAHEERMTHPRILLESFYRNRFMTKKEFLKKIQNENLKTYAHLSKDEKRKEIINDVIKELEKAESKHPEWPNNIYEQLTIIGEEFGELQQAALKHKWEKGYKYDIEAEGIQLAAMCLRFLINFE